MNIRKSTSHFAVTAILLLTETAILSTTFFAQAPAPLATFKPSQAPGRTTGFSVADRVAITNLIHAYALAWNNAEAETWFRLFTPDAVFVAGEPGKEPHEFTGKAFHDFWGGRIADFKQSGDQRRHLESNIVFLDETHDTAHVSVVGVILNTRKGATTSVVTSLNYEGWLVKKDAIWKIQRWYDFPDAVVSANN